MKTVNITYTVNDEEDFIDEDLKTIGAEFGGVADSYSGCSLRIPLERDIEFTFKTAKDAALFMKDVRSKYSKRLISLEAYSIKQEELDEDQK